MQRQRQPASENVIKIFLTGAVTKLRLLHLINPLAPNVAYVRQK